VNEDLLRDSTPSQQVVAKIKNAVGAFRRTRIQVAILAMSVVVFLVVAAVAVVSRQAAITNEREAVGQRDRAFLALRTQSRMLIDGAAAARAQGDQTTALLLGLEGLPDADSENEIRRQWPYTAELEFSLYSAASTQTEAHVIRLPFDVSDRGFAPRPIAAVGVDRMIIGNELFELSTGRHIATFADTSTPINTFVNQDRWIVVQNQSNRTARIVLASDGAALASVLDRYQNISSVWIGPTGESAITLHDDRRILWHRLGGETRQLLSPEECLSLRNCFLGEINYSPDGRRVTLSFQAPVLMLFDATDGAPIDTIMVENGIAISGAVFDPAGSRFVPMSRRTGVETTFGLHDSHDGALLVSFTGHRGGIRTVEFFGEDRLITGGEDNTARC
jgi:hypothetical protein